MFSTRTGSAGTATGSIALAPAFKWTPSPGAPPTPEQPDGAFDAKRVSNETGTAAEDDSVSGAEAPLQKHEQIVE
jgi:hypothetical protein